VTARPIVSEPDTGIPDLIRRLTDDSKRLVTDEVQLAKLETKDSLHRAGRGVLWLVLAFGAGVIALVALTILLATLIGQLDRGHMWFGALLTGILELGLGAYLVKRGIAAYGSSSYTLAETRHALRDTARWNGPSGR
jgi:hypothetical protein